MDKLNNFDARVRSAEDLAKLLRTSVVEMVGSNGQGYLLQGLGAADIFAVLYDSVLENGTGRGAEQRDIFLLSPSHNSAIMYATLHHAGVTELELLSYCKDGSLLESNASELVEGINFTGGSLGMGLSVGLGYAFGMRRLAWKNRVYVLLGDGELAEGQIWEAALCAAVNRQDNLVAIVDDNGIQLDGRCEDVFPTGEMAERWRGFGWDVFEANGNDIAELLTTFTEAQAPNGRPKIIFARTIPGAGVKSQLGRMEHYLLTFTQTEMALALQDLKGARQ